MELLDGKAVSEKIIDSLSKSIKSMLFSCDGGEVTVPKAVFIQLGDEYASSIYIKNKIRAVEKCGFEYEFLKLSEDTSQKALVSIIDVYNNDDSVSGIMVQLPLPAHIDEAVIKSCITPFKDIDGFSEINLGSACSGYTYNIIPATPNGILILMHEYGINVEGKHVVVIGRSDTIGRPLANLLSNKVNNATVTLCHSKTVNIETYTKMADVIICAIGKPNFLTRDMVKEGVDIIDVGINRDSEGKLCGDCDKSVYEVARYVSPVPGGVGPMTVAALMCNICEAANYQYGLEV